MPVQLVILGITLCLLGMLLIHLLFTIRYHLPLSKSNYALQVSTSNTLRLVSLSSRRSCVHRQTSATMLSLVNISIQLRLVMVNLYRNGRQWPFMFDYSALLHRLPPGRVYTNRMYFALSSRNNPAGRRLDKGTTRRMVVYAGTQCPGRAFDAHPVSDYAVPFDTRGQPHSRFTR